MGKREGAKVFSSGIVEFWYNAHAPMTDWVLAVTVAVTGSVSKPSQGGLVFMCGALPAVQSVHSMTPFFLSIALSASRLKSGPSSDGSSVTQSELTLRTFSFSRKPRPRSP